MLQPYKSELQQMTRIASNLFNIEVAIFDINSRLVTCTDNYLRQKGKTVHAPSINEVIEHGKVLVNKPGHMAACSGCRFKGNCPATIEILRAIHIDNTPVGAITFTSFTKRGHDRITDETPSYIETLKLFSEWLSDFVLNKKRQNQFAAVNNTLQTTLDLSRASILTVNHKGMVIQCNNSALQLFSFCDLYTRSLYHIFPEPFVDKILDGKPVKNFRVRINDTRGYVSSLPISGDDNFAGAVIYIRSSKNTAEPVTKQKLPLENLTFDSIKGTSKAIEDIKTKSIKVSDSLSTILISGETGTGKGLLARAIHNSCRRADSPFVSVNCTSIPETLFESELFGYEEGAFTGAQKGGKPGRIELAEGGTLFLDEIGEMPLHMQVKLLNVLQDYAFQRVGGIISIPLDVRFIAATNHNLEELVREKKFRSDLFFRLNVIPLQIAPLTERKEDIPPLSNEFLKQYCSRLNRNITTISSPLMDRFMDYGWPGNVRELQNIIEYCVNMEESDTLTTSSLPDRFNPASPDRPEPAGPLQRDTHDTEAAALLAALDLHGRSVAGKTAAAEELGISLRTLYRKLKKIPSGE